MTTLEISLAAALGAALVAIVVLARYALAQRRLGRQARWAEAKATAGAARERTAREQLAADIMARAIAAACSPRISRSGITMSAARRVDALAHEHGITREAMLAILVRRGLEAGDDAIAAALQLHPADESGAPPVHVVVTDDDDP